MHFEMCLEVTEQSELLVAQITVVWFVAYANRHISVDISLLLSSYHALLNAIGTLVERKFIALYALSPV